MANNEADEFVAATPRVAAGVLFRNERDHVLLVRPIYKSYWDIPGGYAEPGESPRNAAKREVAEELGLDIAPGGLLSVDWAPHENEGDKLLFIFDGGTLTAGQNSSITFPDGEITETCFVSHEELHEYTITRLVNRLRATLDAARTRHPVYLEHGQPAAT